jgi:hypothetical protein
MRYFRRCVAAETKVKRSLVPRRTTISIPQFQQNCLSASSYSKEREVRKLWNTDINLIHSHPTGILEKSWNELLDPATRQG